MHCKDISVRDVGWKLTRGNICANMEDWRAYKRAEYVVLRNGDDMAVVRLRKSPEGSLLREVTGFDIISLPEDTVFADRPDADVVNLPAMARIQSEHPGKTVVVRGLFSHIGFVSDVVPLRLRIIDAVPPRPSKLSYLVDMALRSGYVDLPVVPGHPR